MKKETFIVGAGLAGLITACKIQDAMIMESKPRLEQHKALLRFRDRSVSDATGIGFKEVRVSKSIYANEEHHSICNPKFANWYARKVTGAISGDRSIWNLSPVQRFIAPEDIYDMLCEKHKNRIVWESPLNTVGRGQPHVIINTAPLPVIASACGIQIPSASFSFSPINVKRFRLPKGTCVHQTVYFPEPDCSLFRASITGDLLIVESMFGRRPPEEERVIFSDMGAEFELEMVMDAFGLVDEDLVPIEDVDQKYGKIVEIPRSDREAILYELTREFNVFSIGRFATWRNILLDDVVKDIEIVKKLIDASTYGRELTLANR